jgi:hypothetical protein
LKKLYLHLPPGVNLWGRFLSLVMKILNMGARWIYPAHGRRFKDDELKKLL